jgi:hypothetical protein
MAVKSQVQTFAKCVLHNLFKLFCKLSEELSKYSLAKDYLILLKRDYVLTRCWISGQRSFSFVLMHLKNEITPGCFNLFENSIIDERSR